MVTVSLGHKRDEETIRRAKVNMISDHFTKNIKMHHCEGKAPNIQILQCNVVVRKN